MSMRKRRCSARRRLRVRCAEVWAGRPALPPPAALGVHSGGDGCSRGDGRTAASDSCKAARDTWRPPTELASTLRVHSATRRAPRYSLQDSYCRLSIQYYNTWAIWGSKCQRSRPPVPRGVTRNFYQGGPSIVLKIAYTKSTRTFFIREGATPPGPTLVTALPVPLYQCHTESWEFFQAL